MTEVGGNDQAADGGRRTRLILAVLLVVAMLGSLFVLISSRGSGGGPGEVVLEAASAPGPDPFTDTVATPEATTAADTQAAAAVPAFPLFRATDPDVPSPTVTPVATNEPGLYGGTRDAAMCDPAQLTAFLASNPDKARAWADVHDIGADDVDGFVDRLTPVILRVDTQVTNHGFSGGSATPRQSVLEAGTAVMVDAGGTPRVKCNCGNPLRAADARADQEYAGAPWPTFDEQRVAAPQPAPSRPELIVVDPADGAPFARPVGTAGDADADAPPGIDVSDPVTAAAASARAAGSAESDDPTGQTDTPGAGVGSISIAADGPATLGVDTADITDSTIDLAFVDQAGGAASGPFTVTLEARSGECTAVVELSGTFTGTFDGSNVLTGTWSADLSTGDLSGTCDDLAIAGGSVGGDWSAVFDSASRLVAGSMLAQGSALFDFELQTG